MVSKSNNMRAKRMIPAAIIAAVLVSLAFIGGLAAILYMWLRPLPDDVLAQRYEEAFKSTADPTARLNNLANLFGLPGYDDQARALFDTLPPDEKVALFSNTTPDLQPQVRTAVKGVYVGLAYTEDDNRLLQTMRLTLAQSAETDSRALADEITRWLEGRAARATDSYEEAVRAYDVAIGLNDKNPATHFERGIILATVKDYEGALADFEKTLSLSRKWREKLLPIFENDHQLYLSVWNQPEKYTLLSLLISKIPEPPGTPSPTPTRVVSPTPTPTRTGPPPPLTPMVLIPAGWFELGSEDDETVRTTYLDDFYIDQYEVTNGDYALCVENYVCGPPQQPGSFTRGIYYGNPQYDNYPVINVSWLQAKKYCQWRGARLPTDEEWEKAARGTDGRLYPWGNTFDGNRVNFCDANCKSVQANKNYDDGYRDTAPIDSFSNGVSPYGVYNLAGNVAEWVVDLPSEKPAFQGGSWSGDEVKVRVSTQVATDDPNSYGGSTGFRCARSP